MGVNILAIS